MLVQRPGKLDRSCPKWWSAFVLVLALGLTATATYLSGIATAQDRKGADTATKENTQGADKPQSPAKSVNRHLLRFSGKPFAEWKRTLEYDLDPKTQISAIQALRAFGLRGFRQETIMAVAPFVSSSDSVQVSYEALMTLSRLDGHEAISAALERSKMHDNVRMNLPGLVKKLTKVQVQNIIRLDLSPDRHQPMSAVRHSAIEALSRAEAPYPIIYQAFLKQIPHLIAANDVGGRSLIGNTVAKLKHRSPDALKVMRQLLEDPDRGIRSNTCRRLQQLGKSGEVVEMLLQASGDSDDRVRIDACVALIHLGAKMKEARRIRL